MRSWRSESLLAAILQYHRPDTVQEDPNTLGHKILLEVARCDSAETDIATLWATQDLVKTRTVLPILYTSKQESGIYLGLQPSPSTPEKPVEERSSRGQPSNATPEDHSQPPMDNPFVLRAESRQPSQTSVSRQEETKGNTKTMTMTKTNHANQKTSPMSVSKQSEEQENQLKDKCEALSRDCVSVSHDAVAKLEERDGPTRS
jgi:hypothetical protein